VEALIVQWTGRLRRALRAVWLASCGLAPFLAGAPHLARAQEVFLGSADQWRELTGHPDQWEYVRSHVDGFYVNFIMLRHMPEGLLDKTAGLLTNRRVFLESDHRPPKAGDDTSGATPDDDREFIRKMHASGLSIPYTSLNYGWSPERAANLKSFDKRPGTSRKDFVQIGTWSLGGDIGRDPAGKGTPNAALRTWIEMADGVSTDGPMGLWKSNAGQMREASVSIVRFARQRRKLAMVMLGAYGAHNPDYAPEQFLTASQDAVRYHEDAAAVPDIWTVFEYATEIRAVPEQKDGRPAHTTTGVAYWLLHHLKDPDHQLTLVVSPDGWHRTEDNRARVLDITLSNHSDWLDFAPRLKLGGAERGRHLRSYIDGKDVTAILADGVFLTGPLRLWPGQSHTVRLVVEARRGELGSDAKGNRVAGGDLRLELFPAFGAPIPTQTLRLPAN
jgi:hypothetical protein